jgi:hypothetical protein
MTHQEIDELQNRPSNNSKVVNRMSALLRNFLLHGQESTSNPLLLIHAESYFGTHSKFTLSRISFLRVSNNCYVVPESRFV